MDDKSISNVNTGSSELRSSNAGLRTDLLPTTSSSSSTTLTSSSSSSFTNISGVDHHQFNPIRYPSTSNVNLSTSISISSTLRSMGWNKDNGNIDPWEENDKYAHEIIICKDDKEEVEEEDEYDDEEDDQYSNDEEEEEEDDDDDDDDDDEEEEDYGQYSNEEDYDNDDDDDEEEEERNNIVSLLPPIPEPVSAAIPTMDNKRLRTEIPLLPIIIEEDTVSYTDVIGFVAGTGYTIEMIHTLGLSKDTWYGDELLWSSLVNFRYGPQHKTRLLWRILRHDAEGVRQMIRSGCRVIHRCGISLASTPLIIACLEGNAAVVKLLLEAGARGDTKAIGITNQKEVIIPHFVMRDRHSSMIGYTNTIGNNDSNNKNARTMGMDAFFWTLFSYWYRNPRSNRNVYSKGSPLLVRQKIFLDNPSVEWFRSSLLREPLKNSHVDYTTEYRKILLYLASDTDVMRKNYEDILLTAIDMRCCSVARMAIDAGGHHAACRKINDYNGPSAVLMAAEQSIRSVTMDLEQFPFSITDDCILNSLIQYTSSEFTFDPEMVDIVRSLSMNPRKPRDPYSNQIINLHHCVLAACYLRLEDAITYLIGEDISMCLTEPLNGFLVPTTISPDEKEAYRSYQTLGFFSNIFLQPIHVAAVTGATEILEIYETLYMTGIRTSMDESETENTLLSDEIQSVLRYAATDNQNLAFLQRIYRTYSSLPNELLRASLNIAVEFGTLDIIKELLHHLDMNEEANYRFRNGSTLFHAAIQWNDFTLVDYLCRLPSIRIDTTNRQGETPLMFAMSFTDTEDIVNLLLQYPDCIDVNHPNKDGDTALHIFIAKKKDNYVKSLCSLPSVRLDIANNQGETPLIKAVTDGSSNYVSLLLQYPDRIDINYQDSNGCTALEYAIRKNAHPVVAALVEIPTVDLNLKNSQTGKIPLSVAFTYNSCIEIIDILLRNSNRFDINSQSNEGFTVLHHAMSSSFNETKMKIVERLCKIPNIDCNMMDNKGVTPYDTAIIPGRPYRTRLTALLEKYRKSSEK